MRIKTSSRLIIFTIMLTAYLCFCCYSSVLTSFLAIEEEIFPFRNIEELAERDEYTIVTVKDTTIADYFANSKPGTPHARIWQRMISEEGNLVRYPMEALEKVYSREKCAAVVEGNDDILSLFPGRSYKFIPGDIGFRDFDYIPMRPDFPYNHIVSNKILHMKETGLMDRFKKIYVTKWKFPDNEREVALSLTDVASLCIFLAVGILLSLLVLCIEIVYFHLKRKSFATHAYYFNIK